MISSIYTYIHTYIQPSLYITLLLYYLKSDYLIYYNPSCCPLDNRWPLADVCYNSQASIYRADYTISADKPIACSQSEATSTSRLMSSDVNPEALTAGLPGLIELATKVTALEKIAQIEERLTRLENCKRTNEAVDNPISQS